MLFSIAMELGKWYSLEQDNYFFPSANIDLLVIQNDIITALMCAKTSWVLLRFDHFSVAER